MNSHRTRAFLACAAIVGLTGCSSLSPAGSEAAPAATGAPEASAPATPPEAPDPLEMLSDRPYGYGTAKIQALLAGETIEMEYEQTSATFPAYLELGVDQEGVDLTDAVRTAMQVVWVGDQRDTIFNGWRIENVRGQVKDIEHFVAPSVIDKYLPQAQRALADAEAREVTEAEPTESFDYTLHPGKMAQVEQAVSPEQKAAWPDTDAIVWITSTDESGTKESVPIPRDAKSNSKLPMITEIYDFPGDGDPTHAVIVTVTSEVEAPAEDGRTAIMSLTRRIQVGLEDGRWVVQANSWIVDNTQVR